MLTYLAICNLSSSIHILISPNTFCEGASDDPQIIGFPVLKEPELMKTIGWAPKNIISKLWDTIKSL